MIVPRNVFLQLASVLALAAKFMMCGLFKATLLMVSNADIGPSVKLCGVGRGGLTPASLGAGTVDRLPADPALLGKMSWSSAAGALDQLGCPFRCKSVFRPL